MVSAILALMFAVTLGDYSAAARLELERKISSVLVGDGVMDEVSGMVTCATEDAFFIQGEVDALKIFVKGEKPKVGDEVVIKGSPSLEGGRVVFVAKEWIKKESGEEQVEGWRLKEEQRKGLPEARVVGEKDLIYAGGDRIDRAKDVNWLRVEVEGRAIGETSMGFAMEVGKHPITVFVNQLPDFLKNCDRLRPKVKVTGVVELILDQSALFSQERYVMGVRLHVNAPTDIELKSDAIYLLNKRERWVMILVAGVFIVLIAGLIAAVAVVARQLRGQLRTKTLMTERKRMADDLHDTIEQHLVGAGMLLKLNRTKEAGEVLVRAKREMRDIVWGLKNDDMMRLSPEQMIKELAKEETKKGLYRVSARLEGLPERMQAAEMRDLSLIVREAIGNAVKHGGAKKIAISCEAIEEGGWHLRIANDGTPFEVEKAPGVSEGHFGIEGMKARARRLNAEVFFTKKGDWTILSVKNMV